MFLKLGTLKVYPLVLSKEQEMYSTIKNIEDYSAQKVRGWYHPEILTRVYIVGFFISQTVNIFSQKQLS